MVLCVCPMLAGEGVLGGLRGENRRIEDKFVSLGMEMKQVQIMLDLQGQHGNRLLSRYYHDATCLVQGGCHLCCQPGWSAWTRASVPSRQIC